MVWSSEGLQPAGTAGRQIAAIRAHRPGSDVERTYKMLRSYFAVENIYVVVDQTAGKSFEWNQEYNLVTFDENLLNELDLFVPKHKVGWLCGDYFYICLKEAVDFDYAWLVEPDVSTNFEFSYLLNEVASQTEDLVGAGIAERDSSWSWHQSMANTGHERVFSVFYPLTRVSRKLIEHIHRERRRTAELFRTSKDIRYPNDEAVTGTVAFNNKCSTLDLKRKYPDMFSHFLWGAKWLYPDVLSRFESKKIVHPVLDPDQFADYLKKEIRGNKNSVNFSKLGTSLWSVESINYSGWKRFVLEELSFLVSDSTFNR